ERGTVTAELAIAIPSVLMILGLVMGTARVGVDSVTASALAHDAVRALGAGDSIGFATVQAQRAGASLTLDPAGCVTVRFPAAFGLPAQFAGTARACSGT
ncbi:MAG: hypothetical protein RL431_378, partial [Actinomycetota bacterium]